MFNNPGSENRRDSSSIERMAKLFLLQAALGGDEASFPPESKVQSEGTSLEFANFGEPSVSFPLGILKLGTTTELREWFLSQAKVSRDVPQGQFDYRGYRVIVRIEQRNEEDWVIVEPTVLPVTARD